jgi:hypothetical protein
LPEPAGQHVEEVDAIDVQTSCPEPAGELARGPVVPGADPSGDDHHTHGRGRQERTDGRGATATPPKARTRAPDAASPSPVVRTSRIQNDAVTIGIVLAAEWRGGIPVVRDCGELGISSETSSRADESGARRTHGIDRSEAAT